MTDLIYKRYEKSLGLLTTRFVSLLQKAKDGVLDLKIATNLLAVRQKRRIYDITNVLEGIGLIQKKSKNSVQWIGAGPECTSTTDIGRNISLLRKHNQSLDEHEELLDKQIQYMSQSIKNVMDNPDNEALLFVTKSDILKHFENSLTLVLEAPLGADLSVSKDEENKEQFQLNVQSPSPMGAILLCDIETEMDEDTDDEVESNTNSMEDMVEYSNYLLRLTPPATKEDFSFCLHGSEGLCDLFDIPC